MSQHCFADFVQDFAVVFCLVPPELLVLKGFYLDLNVLQINRPYPGALKKTENFMSRMFPSMRNLPLRSLLRSVCLSLFSAIFFLLSFSLAAAAQDNNGQGSNNGKGGG